MHMQTGWRVGELLLMGTELDISEAQTRKAPTSSQGLYKTLPGKQVGKR